MENCQFCGAPFSLARASGVFRCGHCQAIRSAFASDELMQEHVRRMVKFMRNEPSCKVDEQRANEEDKERKPVQEIWKRIVDDGWQPQHKYEFLNQLGTNLILGRDTGSVEAHKEFWDWYTKYKKTKTRK